MVNHLVIIIVSCLALIQYSNTQRYGGHRGRHRYPDNDPLDEEDEYLPVSYYDGKEIKGRGLVDSGVGKQVKEAIVLIKCVLQCFVKYFAKIQCDRLFPCLFDCYIGQTSITPILDKRIRSVKTLKPQDIKLADIFKQFKCFYDCVIQRPITDWPSLVAVAFCLIDTCFCSNIFGAEK